MREASAGGGASRSNEKITHKELLTFTNLTNLEWEFINLESVGEEERTSNQLNDLLNPELFISGYRDPGEEEDPIYVYSEADEAGNYKREEGLREMREEAGIAMEYQEKDTEEANFLKDWEVIYGADNYKVVKNYLDYKWANLCEGLNSLDNSLNLDEDKDIYPAREDVETAKQWQARLRIAVNTVDLGLSVFTAPAPDEELSEVVENIGLKDLATELTTSFMQKTADNLGEEYGALAIGLALVFNIGDPAKILDKSMPGAEKEALRELTEEIETNVPGEIPEEPVRFDENLDMRDTGFRVVAFRKEASDKKAKDKEGRDKIVVAYKGEAGKEQHGFPQEFELLQLVYNRLKRQNPKAKIFFTGYNRGADLSFINCLFADHRLKYEVKKGDTLSEINEKLSGSAYPWEGELERKNGAKIKQETIYPGEEIYSENEEKKPAVLFYTELEELKKYIQFTPENLGQEYKPFRKVVIPGPGKVLGDFGSRILISVLIIGVKLLKGMRLSSIAVNSILLLNFKLAVITICISLITACREYFQGCFQREVYEEFEQLGLIIGEKDISEGVDSSKVYSSYLKERIVDEEIIKGYITNKFWLKSYIELKIPSFIEPSQKKRVKIGKEIVVYILKNRLIDSGQVAFREGKGGESEAIFLVFNVRGADWLKLVKNEAGIYKPQSLIPTGADNDPLALTPQAEAYKNKMEEIKEWNLVSSLQLKQKLKQLAKEIKALEDKGEDSTEKYFKKEKIEAKKRAVDDYKKELSEAQMTAGLMEIIGDMQRNWEEKKNKIEAIYWNLEAMLEKKEQSIKVSNNVLELAQSDSKENQDKNDGDGVLVDKIKDFFGTIEEFLDQQHEIIASEFGFMPYLTKEGKIDAENLNLREEYKASLFKSAVLYYKELKLYDYYRSLLLQDINIKFGSAELPANYSLKSTGFIEGIVGEGDINEKFLEILEEIQPFYEFEAVRDPDAITKTSICFNHYNNFLEEVREDPEVLEDYYQVKETEEYGIGSWIGSKLSNTKAELILNPMSEEEAVMEYKYNSNDYIVGGELELTVKDVPENIDKKIDPAPDFPVIRLAKAAEGGIDTGNFAKQLAEKTGHSMEFETSDRSIKDIAKKIKEERDDGQAEDDSGEPTKIAVSRLLPVDKRGRA